MTFLYKKIQACVLILLSLLALSLSAEAATITWNKTGGGTYDFSDGTNWSGGVAPASTDDAVFPNAVANPLARASCSCPKVQRASRSGLLERTETQ